MSHLATVRILFCTKHSCRWSCDKYPRELFSYLTRKAFEREDCFLAIFKPWRKSIAAFSHCNQVLYAARCENHLELGFCMCSDIHVHETWNGWQLDGTRSNWQHSVATSTLYYWLVRYDLGSLELMLGHCLKWLLPCRPHAHFAHHFCAWYTYCSVMKN